MAIGIVDELVGGRIYFHNLGRREDLSGWNLNERHKSKLQGVGQVVPAKGLIPPCGPQICHKDTKALRLMGGCTKSLT